MLKAVSANGSLNASRASTNEIAQLKCDHQQVGVNYSLQQRPMPERHQDDKDN